MLTGTLVYHPLPAPSNELVCQCTTHHLTQSCPVYRFPAKIERDFAFLGDFSFLYHYHIHHIIVLHCFFLTMTGYLAAFGRTAIPRPGNSDLTPLLLAVQRMHRRYKGPPDGRYGVCTAMAILGNCFNPQEMGIGEVISFFWTINDPHGLQGLFH